MNTRGVSTLKNTLLNLNQMSNYFKWNCKNGGYAYNNELNEIFKKFRKKVKVLSNGTFLSNYWIYILRLLFQSLETIKNLNAKVIFVLIMTLSTNSYSDMIPFMLITAKIFTILFSKISWNGWKMPFHGSELPNTRKLGYKMKIMH